MARMGGRSPSDLAHFLEGLEFPTTKDELVTYAEDNGAPQEVIDILEQLPDRDYTGIDDAVLAISWV